MPNALIRLMALLAVPAAASWAAFVRLSTLPPTDHAGRMILYYYWNHSRLWWSGVMLATAGVLSLILAASLLIHLVRCAHGRWRALAAAISAAAWLCGTVSLAVIVLLTALAIGFEGTQTIARSPDGTVVMITQGGFDGDFVNVWRPATSMIWKRVPGAAKVDPRSGHCRLERKTELLIMLSCGPTSQLISIKSRQL